MLITFTEGLTLAVAEVAKVTQKQQQQLGWLLARHVYFSAEANKSDMMA